MNRNIGFIALGQGGGNIGLLLEQAGYTVLFMNTAKEDLATLKDVKYTYHITNGEGCNKNRDKAKDLIIEDFENIAKQIDEKIQEEYIYVIFSAGGGTGSGGGPMLVDLLIQHANRKVGAITILPSTIEPLKTFINSYECFNELENIENMCSTFILDNNKLGKTQINNYFINLFAAFLEIPTHISTSGNIDTAEIYEMLSTRGAMVICNAKDKEATTAGVINKFENNIFATIESDRVIKYIGISAIDPLNTDHIIKAVGTPIDIFQGKNPNETIVVLCGLSYPYGMLETMRKTVSDNQDLIMKNLTATQETKLSDGVNFLNSIPAISKAKKGNGKKLIDEEETPGKAPDKKSIFDKYKK